MKSSKQSGRPPRLVHIIAIFIFVFFAEIFFALKAPPLYANDPTHCLSRVFGPFFDNKDAQDFEAAYGAITADLYGGEILSIRPFNQNDNKHSLFLVTIRGFDPYTGAERFREAFFKPKVDGNEDGWSRVEMEYVAFYLNRKLGMNYIPPTAYRRGLNLFVDGHVYREGAFIFRVPEFTPLADLPYEAFPESHEAIIADHRVLAVLLQNQDGHYRNLGIGKHWVDGKKRPIFLDWGASLRQGTSVTMTEYPAFGNSSRVKKIRRKSFESLKRLSQNDLKILTESRFISWSEMNGILSRKDGIVSYFQGLVDKTVQEGKSADQILLSD